MDIALKCSCGSLRGVITDVSRSSGDRAICLCDDCQAYAHYLGRAKDMLDANGGTDILPVVPASLKIIHGIENLKCVRLTEKGMFRWYAGCCRTPISNSMPSHRIPFTGVVHLIMDIEGGERTRDKVLGPVRARMQGRDGIGPLPPGTYQTAPVGLILRVIRFLFVGLIKRKYKPSPYFSVTGEPRVTPYVLTSPERESLRKYCGPHPTAF